VLCCAGYRKFVAVESPQVGKLREAIQGSAKCSTREPTGVGCHLACSRRKRTLRQLNKRKHTTCLAPKCVRGDLHIVRGPHATQVHRKSRLGNKTRRNSRARPKMHFERLQKVIERNFLHGMRWKPLAGGHQNCPFWTVLRELNYSLAYVSSGDSRRDGATHATLHSFLKVKRGRTRAERGGELGWSAASHRRPSFAGEFLCRFLRLTIAGSSDRDDSLGIVARCSAEFYDDTDLPEIWS